MQGSKLVWALPLTFVAGIYLATDSQRAVAVPIPQTMHYQGRLTDSNGVPVEGTVGKLTFRVYDSPTPANPAFLWGEIHRTVPVNRGVFTVLLGNGAERIDPLNGAPGTPTSGAHPFEPGDFDGGPRFLQVQVDADAPLSPLVPLSSVPYAIVAGTAQSILDPANPGQSLDLGGLSDRFLVDPTGGSEGNVLTLTGGVPQWRDNSQVAFTYADTTNIVVCAATAIWDDSVPLVGEGTHVLSLPYTPKKAGHLLQIEFHCSGGTGLNTRPMLFFTRDAAPAAFYATTILSVRSDVSEVHGRVIIPVTDLAPRVYKAYIGVSSGGSFTVNGFNNARLLGGAQRATFSLKELAP